MSKVKNKKINKKERIVFSIVAIFVVIMLVLSIVLPIVLRKPKDEPFKIPELNLPEEEMYALTKLKYGELGDVQTTVRADSMNVTKRGLARPTMTKDKILSDDFALVYTENGNSEYGAKANSLFPVYGSYTEKSGEHVASISFNPKNYPAPYYGKASATTNVYKDAVDAVNAGISDETKKITEADYFAYYKYMYMTQGQHLAHEASRRSKLTASDSDGINADFANWLKKHPAADGQYGAVKGTNNAVQKEIILDPLYRSLHTTGLYLPAGEPVTIKVEGLKSGERIGITLGSNNTLAWRGSCSGTALNSTGLDSATINQYYKNYVNTTCDGFFKQADLVTAFGKFFDYNNSESSPFLQSQWKRQNARAPWTSCDFTFSENKTYTFGFAYGGLIQINMGNCYSQAKVTITGAVETPHYILGVTSPEYFEQHLKNAPGVIAALDTENGILTGPTGELGNPYCAYMRTVKKEEIDKLAMLWHSFLSVNESFTGGTYNRHNKVMFDWHVPAGAAVSLGNYSFAMPTGWFGAAMNYQGLLATGTWGTLHEIGHNHASAYGQTWGFGDPREGEVRNNALTLLGYIMFCDVGTTVRMGRGAEHGGYANPYSTLSETLNFPKQTHTDIGDGSFGYFQFLGMYANIMHSFGAEKFYELLYSYKDTANYLYEKQNELIAEIEKENLPTEEKNNRKNKIYTNCKRAEFAYRCSIIYGMNFLNYFNNFYFANIDETLFSSRQLNKMKSLPNYNPISCYYAGGIDGVKTAGDYEVAFGDDIEFDLLDKTISTLDRGDKKGFEILSVSQPKHGTIKDVGKGKWSYSFDKDYTGNTDEFSFKVKLSDGVIHVLTVYLRITSFNSSKVNSYTNISEPSGGNLFDNFAEQIKAKSPKTVASGAGATLPAYNGEKWQVRTADFYWKAPVTGEVALMVGGTVVRLYVGENFDNLQPTNLTFSGDINPNKFVTNVNFKHVLSVEQGKLYAIRILSYNQGAGSKKSSGGVYVLTKDGGVVSTSKMDNAKYSEFVSTGANWQLIPSNQVFHPDYLEFLEENKEEFEKFVFEPSYIVSKKANVNLSVTGTDKTEWQVVKAPEVIHQGFYYNEATQTADERTRGHYTKQVQYLYPAEAYDENGNLKEGYEDKRTAYTEYINMWNYLIDGEVGTSLHTPYTGSGYTPLSENNPHEFIIDMKQAQEVNFFSVTTRNNTNSYIEAYDLYLGLDNPEGGVSWEKVTSGTRKDYSGTTITKKFKTRQARYLRLVVRKTSGGTFSVLSEIDAGIQSPIQKLITTTSSKLFSTKGWVNSSEIDSEPNGYLIANSKKQKAVIKFKGDSISLYAATGKDYGSITIKMDGKVVSTVDLNHEQSDLRKLVYYAEDLENKEHTMEIITNSSGKVMLGIIGLPYSASLLNAPNIYLERALIISLVVFILLFVALTVLVLCLLFIPKFRHFMGNNRAISWLDRKMEADKIKRQEKRKIKKQQKAEQKQLQAILNKENSNSKLEDTKTKTTAKPAKPSNEKQTQKENKVKTSSNAIKSSKDKKVEKPKSINAEKPKQPAKQEKKPIASKTPTKQTKTANNKVSTAKKKK